MMFEYSFSVRVGAPVVSGFGGAAPLLGRNADSGNLFSRPLFSISFIQRLLIP